MPPDRPVTEHQENIDGQPIFWRSAPHDGDVPALYVHGVPTSSHDWLPFLARGGGLAPDLIGFGASAKRGDLDYSIDGIADFIESFLDHVGVDRVALVVHDWGAAALAFAQRHPDRIARVLVMDAVPLLPGYRWHRIARLWRTRVVGEMVMGATTRISMRVGTREANVTPGPLPRDMLDAIWAAFDPGTQRAILKLYRSAPPDVLARAGAHLEEIGAPALVVWGEHDPYIPARFAEAYAERLGDARVERLPDAGHWPWLDRPDLIERVVDFATAG